MWRALPSRIEFARVQCVYVNIGCMHLTHKPHRSITHCSLMIASD